MFVYYSKIHVYTSLTEKQAFKFLSDDTVNRKDGKVLCFLREMRNQLSFMYFYQPNTK